MERSSRIFYTALLLLTLAGLGWGTKAAGAMGLTFAFFSALTLGGSLICIWERSVVRSAFSLMATFSGVAGLFLLLGSDFLSMAQILIYVGGILALLLFGVMLTPPDLGERKIPRVLGTIVVTCGAVLFVALQASTVIDASTVWAVEKDLPPVRGHATEIGLAFVDPTSYLIAFELAAFFLTVALVAAVYIARRRRLDLQPADGGSQRSV
jgi:NADH-quinone oxidoreductase subunit J